MSAASTSRVEPVVAILAVLALGMGTAIWRIHSSGDVSAPLPALETRVNPNTAPWWELMALPEIGESTARKIVDYRELHADRMPVFRSPADLEPVPDIGPKTIQRIAPYLRFD